MEAAMSAPATLSNGLLATPQPLDQRLRYVPFAVDVWCPVFRSRQLWRNKMKVVPILGRDYVFFRGNDGVVNCLEDRCPHRGVALSLGRVKGTAIQCEYHGWSIKGDGRPRHLSACEGAGPRAEGFATVEKMGEVWVFIGDRDKAASAPFPDLSPYGSPEATDIRVRKRIKAHWSLIFDNGMDLFHQHLHRNVPFFFRVKKLAEYGSRGDEFYLRYEADMAARFGLREQGDLKITVRGTHFKLDLCGHPIIHSFILPHSADGRDVTTSWFITLPGRGLYKLYSLLMWPLVYFEISRGFQQDVRALESEQRALDQGNELQYELNPAVRAGHQHIIDYLLRHSAEQLDLGMEQAETPTEPLVEQAELGRKLILVYRNGELSLLHPKDLRKQLKHKESVSVYAYHHTLIVKL